MKILISGAGIAGPTLAYWLHHYGHEPVLVERAPELRTGGYVIDFWGSGFDVAERMGIVPDLREDGYVVREVRVVDERGKRKAWFPVESLSRLAHYKYVSIPRGDVAARTYASIAGRVETRFGDSIAELQQDSDGVDVRFESGTSERYDLVVGADGLHSRVRELAFGAESAFEKYLGYKVAAFETSDYPHRDELVYLMFTEVGQQVDRFTLRDNRTMFLFVYADEDSHVPHDLRGQKDALIQRFRSSGWETPEILRFLEAADSLYIDRVSQIRMPGDPTSGLHWSKGRVTLLGDAAWCVSLLAGEGSALAMTGAYILAGELYRSRGDYTAAFRSFEERFLPLVLTKQQGALRFAATFAPPSRFSMFLRNVGMNLLRVPWLGDLLVGRSLRDNIELPEYELSAHAE